MITIDLDNKFAIVSDGEVLNLVQKDGKMPIETHITPFDLNIEQHGIVGELRCVD